MSNAILRRPLACLGDYEKRVMPTHLIKKYIEEFACWVRNAPDYCDWTVGMEPIPYDKTWVTTKNPCSASSDQSYEEVSSKPSEDPNHAQF